MLIKVENTKGVYVDSFQHNDSLPIPRIGECIFAYPGVYKIVDIIWNLDQQQILIIGRIHNGYR